MSNTFEYINETDAEALIEELELRYGPAVAQEIADQLGRTAQKGQAPQYMVVKAASEVLELFRGEAKATMGQLKALRREAANNPKIAYLAERKLELEFRRLFRLYWTSMKLFYPLYAAALASFKNSPSRGYSRPHGHKETSLAA